MSTAEQTVTASAGGQVQESANALELAIEETVKAMRPQTEKEKDYARDYFRQFLDHAVKPGHVVSNDVEANIKYWIAEIDRKLSDQLNEILHKPDFQRLEGSWRGLHYLVHKPESDE